MKSVRILGTLVLFLALTLVSATTARADALYANDELACGNSLYSGNGYYRLYCVGGTFSTYLALVYQGPGSPSTLWTSLNDSLSSGLGTHTDQWASVANNARAIMQGDGNFVLYNNTITTAVWASFTDGNYDAWLNLQDDGNMVVYTSSNVPIWSTL